MTKSNNLCQESESEEGLDEVDDDNDEENEHEPEVHAEKESVVEKPAEIVAPKESERQLSKKELKKKELAELEEMLAQFGYKQPKDQDASQGRFCIFIFFDHFIKCSGKNYLCTSIIEIKVVKKVGKC